jgi:hypothetical protein
VFGGYFLNGPNTGFDGQPSDVEGVLLHPYFKGKKADFGDGVALHTEVDLPRPIVGTEEKKT